MYYVKYCDCTLLESCISLILRIIKSFSKLIWWILLTFLSFFSFVKISSARFISWLHFKKPKFDHNFFPWDCLWEWWWLEANVDNTPIDDKECICWPQMWIPKDLNDNVKILSLSYDSNVVAGVHNDVTKIGQNLIQSLVTNSRCDNFLIYGHLIFHCVSIKDNWMHFDIFE